MVVIAHWLLVITRYYGISVGKWGSAVLRYAMERSRNVRLCSAGRMGARAGDKRLDCEKQVVRRVVNAECRSPGRAITQLQAVSYSLLL